MPGLSQDKHKHTWSRTNAMSDPNQRNKEDEVDSNICITDVVKIFTSGIFVYNSDPLKS